jgi:hypothetical protein
MVPSTGNEKTLAPKNCNVQCISTSYTIKYGTISFCFCFVFVVFAKVTANAQPVELLGSGKYSRG